MLRPSLPAFALICLASLMLGCVQPVTNQPPRDLDLVLGAANHSETETDPSAVPTRQRSFDLEPFFQSGLPTPNTTLPRIITALAYPESFESPYRLEVVGRHLVVRHRPAMVAKIEALLEHLETSRLPPIHLDLHMVKVGLALAEQVAARDGLDTTLAPALREAILAGLADGSAQTLARRRLRLCNGQWSESAEGQSRRPVVRLNVQDGKPIEVQETLEDGLAVKAAIWLAAPGDALLHLEAALQAEEPSKSRRLEMTYHPDLRQPDREVQAGIDLQTLHTTAVRGQMLLDRARWHVFGAAPAPEPDQVVLVLVRARWTPAAALALQPWLPGGRIARTVPIALPESRDLRAEQSASGYVWELKTGEEHASKWFAEERTRQDRAAQSVSNWGPQGSTSFGTDSVDALQWGRGIAADEAFQSGTSTGGWLPLLPDALTAKLAEVQRARWDKDSALFFEWDSLFLVHNTPVVEATAGLLEEVQAWRNRPIRVRAEWLELPPALAEAMLDAEDLTENLAALRAHRLSAPFELVARSGAWSELAVSRNYAVLWGFFAEDRPSPELRTLDQGGKLSLLPRRYGSGRVELELRFSVNELDADSLEPVEEGGGLLHRPRFAQSKLEESFAVENGKPVLLLDASLHSGSEKIRALLVTADF